MREDVCRAPPRPCRPGAAVRQVDVDLSDPGAGSGRSARGRDELLDVCVHLVEHGWASTPGGSAPRAISAVSQASQLGPAESGREDPLGDPPPLSASELDGEGVLGVTGPVPQRHAEAFAQEDLHRVAEEAIEPVELDVRTSRRQGVGQERREVPVADGARPGRRRG